MLVSICVTVLSARLATQTDPPPTTRSAGRTPTGTWAITFPSSGSRIATLFAPTSMRSLPPVVARTAATATAPTARAALTSAARRPAARRVARWAPVGGLDLEEALAFGEALERDAATVAKPRVGHRARQLPDGVGHEYLAAAGAVHHARGEVDRGPEQLAVALDHLARVEPDPQPDAVVLHREVPLDRLRAFHSAARGVEQHEHAVARGTHTAAAMGRDVIANDAVVRGELASGGGVALARRRAPSTLRRR